MGVQRTETKNYIEWRIPNETQGDEILRFYLTGTGGIERANSHYYGRDSKKFTKFEVRSEFYEWFHFHAARFGGDVQEELGSLLNID